MTQQGYCQIPTDLLHKWLDLPEDCHIVEIYQEPTDLAKKHFRVVCNGEGMPSVAEGEAALPVTLHLAHENDDFSALQLKQITSIDRKLVFWPEWSHYME